MSVTIYKKYLKQTVAVAAFMTMAMCPVEANASSHVKLPTGENVTYGSADFSRDGAALNITQNTDKVIIDWDRFDIGQNAQVNFNQLNSNSVGVNRVVGNSTKATQILGGLNANGTLVVLDKNGVIFGKKSVVNVGGLIASTGDINVDRFTNHDEIILENISNGKIVNRGEITIAQRGLAAFVAPTVENRGLITAKLGKVHLAGTSLDTTVDLYGDGLLEIAVDKEKLKTKVNSSGSIIAEGGYVALTATAVENIVKSVINVSGVINVASAKQEGGKIVLSAANKAGVRVNAKLDASSDKKEAGSIKISGHDVHIKNKAVLDTRSSHKDAGDITVSSRGKGTYEGDFFAASAHKQDGAVSISGDNKLIIRQKFDIDVGDGGEFSVNTKNVRLSGRLASASKEVLEAGSDVNIVASNDFITSDNFNWDGPGSLAIDAGNVKLKHSIIASYNDKKDGGDLSISSAEDISAYISPRNVQLETGSGDLSLKAGNDLILHSRKNKRDVSIISETGDISLVAEAGKIVLGDADKEKVNSSAVVKTEEGDINILAEQGVSLNDQSVLQAVNLFVEADKIEQSAKSAVNVKTFSAKVRKEINLDSELNTFSTIGPMISGFSKENDGGISLTNNGGELTVVDVLQSNGGDIVLNNIAEGDIIFEKEVKASDIEELVLNMTDGELVQKRGAAPQRPRARVPQSGNSAPKNDVSKKNIIENVFNNLLNRVFSSIKMAANNIEFNAGHVSVGKKFSSAKSSYNSGQQGRVQYNVVLDEELNNVETFAGSAVEAKSE